MVNQLVASPGTDGSRPGATAAAWLPPLRRAAAATDRRRRTVYARALALASAGLLRPVLAVEQVAGLERRRLGVRDGRREAT
jgi:hypothetical protein